MPKISDILFGKKPKLKQVSTLSPEQQQLMKLITEGLSKGEGAFKDLFGGFDKGAFDAGVTQPALQNFKENILPMVQEKFIAGNQVGGTGMQRGMLREGGNLQARLAEMMYQAQQAQKQNQFGGLQTALGTRPFENVYKSGTTGIAQKFLGGLSPGLGQMGDGGLAGILQQFMGRGAGQSTIPNPQSSSPYGSTTIAG